MDIPDPPKTEWRVNSACAAAYYGPPGFAGFGLFHGANSSDRARESQWDEGSIERAGEDTIATDVARKVVSVAFPNDKSPRDR